MTLKLIYLQLQSDCLAVRHLAVLEGLSPIIKPPVSNMHTCQIDEALTRNWMNDYKKTQYEVKIVVNASDDGLPDWCLLLT